MPMDSKSEFDTNLIKKLTVLQTSSNRNPDKATTGRAAFLREAQELAGAVTPLEKWRHNGWMYTLQTIFVICRKEHSPMFNTIATIILIISLVLGGGGVTVAAAQGSQPDQPLYDVKLWSEDFRLSLAADPQTQFRLSLDFANKRSEEILKLLQAGSIPTDVVQNRYQNQIENAIQFAMNLQDDQAIQALQQIQVRMHTQQQAFLQAQTDGSPNAESMLTQTRRMIQERLKWIEDGLSNPAQLREILRQRDRLRQVELKNSVTPTEQNTQMAPGTGGGNPWTTGTPTPGSGYGPGECVNCTPTGNGQDGNPWTTGTPTPGSGYGPGPDPTRTCTPGSGDGAGSQPTQPQPGQSTQAGSHPTAIPGGNH